MPSAARPATPTGPSAGPCCTSGAAAPEQLAGRSPAGGASALCSRLSRPDCDAAVADSAPGAATAAMPPAAPLA
eukprot:365226-Chlamydomonas_euryale.AAC.20